MAIIPADEKVFMVDKRTNTVYGGSQALQDMQQWYTMQDVSDSVQPYKVFTALLTQSGGDDPQTQSSGSVQKGVTYFVDGGTIGLTDFSNVGGEFQTPDTGSYYFIATIDGTPNEYGGATADYNGGAPVVTVLENTIGNIWFTYDVTGLYSANSDALFTVNKTVSFNSVSTDPGNPDFITIQNSNVNTVSIKQFDFNGDLVNTITAASIEIRVYN
jgi:hypothetical protein